MTEETFLGPERERLQGMRDDLKVQIHLAGAELRDRFEDLERQWHRFEGRMAVLGDTASEDARDVGDAARLLLDEIREGYEHIRSRM